MENTGQGSKSTRNYNSAQRKYGTIPELALEVWPESHWPGFALRQADVFQSYAV